MKTPFLTLTALLLSACAAQWHQQTDTLGQSRYLLNTTHTSTLPENGLKHISEQNLQAGDILFSSENSAVSLGIRAVNLSTVSHAFIYLGDGQIAEAVGSGVSIRPLAESLTHSNRMFAMRRPGILPADAEKMRTFAEAHRGQPYNFFGIAKQLPYSITRNVCELPVIPRQVRHLCLNSLALVQITPFASNERFFCSQFVVEAFNRTGKPLTDTPPEWVSPADLMHMRSDDVPAVQPVVALEYVGHLQCSSSLFNPDCREAAATAYTPPAAPDSQLAWAQTKTP